MVGARLEVPIAVFLAGFYFWLAGGGERLVGQLLSDRLPCYWRELGQWHRLGGSRHN